jgi:hypothetical protein
VVVVVDLDAARRDVEVDAVVDGGDRLGAVRVNVVGRPTRSASTRTAARQIRRAEWYLQEASRGFATSSVALNISNVAQSARRVL